MVATEWFAESQAELLAHPHKPEHIFIDVLHFLAKPVQKELKRLESIGAKIGLSSLIDMIFCHQASIPSAYCTIHRRECEHPRAHRHTAGMPCINFSLMAMGNGCGTEGNTSMHLVAWVSLRLRLMEPIIVHEIVLEFPVSVLTRCFGHAYNIQGIELNPVDYGWASRRSPLWRSITLKDRRIPRPVSLIHDTFRRTCTMTYHAYLVADLDHFEQERAWAVARP